MLVDFVEVTLEEIPIEKRTQQAFCFYAICYSHLFIVVLDK